MKIKFYSRLKAFYIRFKGRPAALERAIRKADRLCKKNRRRYRVYFIGGKYRVLNRTDIQQLKRNRAWSRNVNVTKMRKFEFYDTYRGISKERVVSMNSTTGSPKTTGSLKNTGRN